VWYSAIISFLPLLADNSWGPPQKVGIFTFKLATATLFPNLSWLFLCYFSPCTLIPALRSVGLVRSRSNVGCTEIRICSFCTGLDRKSPWGIEATDYPKKNLYVRLDCPVFILFSIYWKHWQRNEWLEYFTTIHFLFWFMMTVSGRRGLQKMQGIWLLRL